MRIHTIPALVLILISASCSRDIAYTPEIQQEMDKLDLALERKEEIEANKTAQINEIHGRLTSDSTPEEKFKCYDDLYYAFQKYDTDSSMIYARKKLEIAEKYGSKDQKDDALMNIVESYTMSCMYTEAANLLSRLDTTSLSSSNQVQYYHRIRLLYDGLAENSEDDSMKTIYLAKSSHYVGKVLEVMDEDSDSHFHVTSEQFAKEGRYDEAISILEEHYRKEGTSMNARAITCYLMARCHAEKGDMQKALLYYTISSTLDLETPIYGYRSLCELSVMLYELGDIERSHRYMVRSFDDITKSSHMSCLQSLYSLTPIISQAYHEQMGQKSLQMIVFITILTLALILMLIVLYTYIKQRRKANNLNISLTEYVDSLKESNDIKDSYLGKYIDMCSEYIEGLARYRSNLRHISKEKGAEELAKALKSTTFMDNELKRFYSEFDSTFLTLFPLFVTHLNLLLQEDKRIDVDSLKGGMSTELRIMALIRLGISDSTQIARFLRRSVSTVYNYRVKMRNSAIGDRNEFEKNLMKIGKIS